MYPFGQHDYGISRKTRDILILVVCALLVVNIVQFIFYRTTATRDAALREALVSSIRSDVDAALSSATHLSRTGGTNTQRLLGEIRQYLYGMTKVNNLNDTLLGGGALVPQATVNAAISAVDECENRQQAGSALDSPLSELWTQLYALQEAVGAL